MTRPNLRPPGSRPPVWRAPTRNDFFAGRDDELADIERLLGIRRLVEVSARDGRPDLGEAEAVVEFCHRYNRRYEAVWWVRCQPGNDVAGQLGELTAELRARFGGALGVPVDERPGGARVPRLRPGWLVVFAGVPDAARLDGLLPGGNGHVLVVRPRPAPGWAGARKVLGPLNRAESIQLLRGVAPMVDADTADAIAECLGDRPAALFRIADRIVGQDTLTPAVCLAILQLAVPSAGMTTTGDDRIDGGARNGQVVEVGAAAGRGGARQDPAGDRPAGPPDRAGPSTGDARTELERQEQAERAAAERQARSKRAERERHAQAVRAALSRVRLINDPDGFRLWLAELGSILGRPVDLPAAPLLATRLTDLVRRALGADGPLMLTAMAAALEHVAVDQPVWDEPAVGQLRDLAANVGTALWPTAQPPTIQPGHSVIPAVPAAAGRTNPATPAPSSPTGSSSGATPARPGGGPAAVPHFFFTSYVHPVDEDDDWSGRFHEDLLRQLRQRASRRPPATAFIDRQMPAGVRWGPELRDAARTAHVMIALLSDDYFGSSWCGREFAIFDARAKLTAAAGGTQVGIIPIRWVPFSMEKAPECVAEYQIATMNLGPRYEGIALLDLMQSEESQYRRFLNNLAYRIIEVAGSPVRTLDADTADQLSPAFGSDAS